MLNYSSHFTVIYDANVLYPSVLRDVLIQLAAHSGLYRAKWTRDINDEWIEALLSDRPDITREDLEYTREEMNRSVDDVLVTDYRDLISSVNLPDSDDEHVLAAAIRAQADVIVTFNKDDFPSSEISKYDLEAKTPGSFLVDVYSLDPALVRKHVKNVFVRLENPPLSRGEYLRNLESIGLEEFVKLLRNDNWLIGS